MIAKERLIHLRQLEAESIHILLGSAHLSEETPAFIDALLLDSKGIKQVSKRSSLKLCVVTEGVADIYSRLAPTMEWDTASDIVRESGKMTYQFENDEPVIYNKINSLNPWFVVN